ncbi:MAG: hypothetical protein ACTSWZ_03440 [Candidatus Heimdallarchaeaceae archaeon]
MSKKKTRELTSSLILMKSGNYLQKFPLQNNFPELIQIKEYLRYFLIMYHYKDAISFKLLPQHKILIVFVKSKSESIRLILGKKGSNLKAIQESFKNLGWKFLLKEKTSSEFCEYYDQKKIKEFLDEYK